MPETKSSIVNSQSPIHLSLVVAMSRNRVIGRNNQLPWRMSADMKHFKALTMDHAIIMGRRTFESMSSRPLTGRSNIVITRRADFHPEGVSIAHDLDEAIELAESLDRRQHHKGEVFIIGGAEIFAAALPRASRIHQTLIEAEIEGDTFFPPQDKDQWRVTRDEPHSADDKNDYPCRIQVLERVTNVR